MFSESVELEWYHNIFRYFTCASCWIWNVWKSPFSVQPTTNILLHTYLFA